MKEFKKNIFKSKTSQEIFNIFEGVITSASAPNSGTMCSVTPDTIIFMNDLILINGSIIYTSVAPYVTFTGTGEYYHLVGENGQHYKAIVANDGTLSNVGSCP